MTAPLPPTAGLTSDSGCAGGSVRVVEAARPLHSDSASSLAVMAGGIALTGGLLAGNTGTAGAAETAPQAASDCPSGWFCVWAGKNYTGRMHKVEGKNANLTGFVVFQGFKSW